MSKRVFYVHGDGPNGSNHEKYARQAFGRDAISEEGDTNFEWSFLITIYNQDVDAKDIYDNLKTLNNSYGKISGVTELDVDKHESSRREQRWLEDLKDAIRDSNKGINEGIEQQVSKYGNQRISALAWLAVVMEELGEAVAEFNKQNLKEFEEELDQTIACLVRFRHEVRREFKGIHEEEADLYVRQS